MKVDNAKQVSNEKQAKKDSLSTKNNEITNSIDGKATEEQIRKEPKKKNKFYSVYLTYGGREKGVAASFIPKTLNPDFDPLVDNEIVSYGVEYMKEDEMFICIEELHITKEAKAQIRKIAGPKKYKKAMQEIEKEIRSFKEEVDYGTSNGIPIINK